MMLHHRQQLIAKIKRMQLIGWTNSQTNGQASGLPCGPPIELAAQRPHLQEVNKLEKKQSTLQN